MERLGLLDASFWDLEGANAALHIGSVCVFAGPAPSLRDVRAHLDERLAALPRYRQLLQRTPLHLARPAWVDDPHFSVDRHVTRAHLPGAAGAEELRALTNRFLTRRLRTDRPLWEIALVDNLSGDRWAMLWKIHHSMVDGVGGMELLAAVMDVDPAGRREGRRPEASTAPAPKPPRWRAAADGLRETLAGPIHLTRRVLGGASTPIESGRRVVEATRGVLRYAEAVRPLPHSCLLGDLTATRTVDWAELDLATITEIREAFGGSVNDVLLAAVGVGLRELLVRRGDHPGHGSVRALVPVSVRPVDSAVAIDNHVSALVVDLPVHTPNIVTALQTVIRDTYELKRSGEAAGGALLVDLGADVPAAAMDLGLRALFALPQRSLSTVVTNVPGVSVPMYFQGRELLSIHPYVPLADRIRLAVAMTSYHGRCYVTVTADGGHLPDAHVVAETIERAVAEALAGARAASEAEARLHSMV